jgi:RNA polymerase sigma-70 factor (ECF subfamily)
MAANEEQLLRQFQASGSRDALRELLVVHQDRIYNACLQVLGRAEDAEDAAQEALLKLADGARAARDADAFRGWIYRVSFRVALDHWRRREAVKNRESRAAMNRPSAPPLDDRERVALFEAMDGLDDRERALLLEHYFEKVPLANLGERRGVSAVAIWKRIDRAREKLKKSLLGAGFVAASAGVSEALEASVPATAPATLVGEAMLGKILAGGLAVGATKSSVLPIAVVSLVLLFGISTGGYVLLRSRKPAKPGPVSSTGISTAPKSPEEHADAPMAPQPDEPDANPASPRDALRKRLEKYLAWYQEKHGAWERNPYSHPRYNFDALREGLALLKGAREMIFNDPKTFLEFIRDPAHEGVCDVLIEHVLCLYERRSAESLETLAKQEFSQFPVDLGNGILELLKNGAAAQKAPLLRVLRFVDGVPELFKEQYAVLLFDQDPGVQAAAILTVSRTRPLPTSLLDPVRTVYETSADATVRRTALEALGRTDTEEVQRWMVGRLGRGDDPDLVRTLAQASLNSLRTKGDVADDKMLDRHASALTAAARVRLDGGDGHMWVVLAALRLPANRAIPVLETVVGANAPGSFMAKAVTQILEKIRTKGLDPQTLSSEFRDLWTPRGPSQGK